MKIGIVSEQWGNDFGASPEFLLKIIVQKSDEVILDSRIIQKHSFENMTSGDDFSQCDKIYVFDDKHEILKTRKDHVFFCPDILGNKKRMWKYEELMSLIPENYKDQWLTSMPSGKDNHLIKERIEKEIPSIETGIYVLDEFTFDPKELEYSEVLVVGNLSERKLDIMQEKLEASGSNLYFSPLLRPEFIGEQFIKCEKVYIQASSEVPRSEIRRAIQAIIPFCPNIMMFGEEKSISESTFFL